MNQLTLNLPETLYRQLESLARSEGVSVGQYALYALTRQASSAYRIQAVPIEIQAQEKAAFATLLQNLGQASETEVEQALYEREIVAPEPELSQELSSRANKKRYNEGYENADQIRQAAHGKAGTETA